MAWESAGQISLYSKVLRPELTESRAVGVFELLPRWYREHLGDPQSTEQYCCPVASALHIQLPKRHQNIWPGGKDDL